MASCWGSGCGATGSNCGTGGMQPLRANME
jgi:hypothetical protein